MSAKIKLTSSPSTVVARLVSALVLLALVPRTGHALTPKVVRDPFSTSAIQAGPGDLLVLSGADLNPTGDVDAIAVIYRRQSNTITYNAPCRYLDGSGNVNPYYATCAEKLPAQEHPQVQWGLLEVVDTSNVDQGLLTVRLPPTMEKDAIYALYVDNGQGTSLPVFINDPRPLWFSPPYVYDTPAQSAATTSPAYALPRTLKVVGRNLAPKAGHETWVKLVRQGGAATYVFAASETVDTQRDPNQRLDHYVAMVDLDGVVVPSSPNQGPLGVGKYDVFVSRDSGTFYAKWETVPSFPLDDPSAQTGAFEIKATPTKTVYDLPATTNASPLKDLPCQPGDPLDDSYCIARALKIVSEQAGKGTLRLAAGTWIIDPHYFTNDVEGEYVPSQNPVNGDDCVNVALRATNYSYASACLLSYDTPVSLTAVVTERDGIIIPEGVSLIGSSASIRTSIQRGAAFRLHREGALFTVYRDSQVRDLDFLADLHARPRMKDYSTTDGQACNEAAVPNTSGEYPAADAELGCSSPQGCACFMVYDDATAAIQLGCSAQSMVSTEAALAPPYHASACDAPVENIVIAKNALLGGSAGVRATGKPVFGLFIVDNTFAARDFGLELNGSRAYAQSSFQVVDALVTKNRFYPGSGLDQDQILRRSNGVGSIASNVHGALRLDFSENTADGKVLSYDAALDAHGFRTAFFFGLASNHEKVLASLNEGYCTGDKIGDGEFLSVDNNGNSFGYRDDYLFPVSPNAPLSACTADDQCPGESANRRCDLPTGKCYLKSYHVTPRISFGVNNAGSFPYVVLSKGLNDRPWPQYSDQLPPATKWSDGPNAGVACGTDVVCEAESRRDFYSKGHYLVITSGVGTGQARRIIGIDPGYSASTHTSEIVYVDRPFDVAPVSGPSSSASTSRFAILSSALHFFQVANKADTTGCVVSQTTPNAEGKFHQGAVGFYSAALHSVVDGNHLIKTGGVSMAQGTATGTWQYFTEVSHNRIVGEPSVLNRCSISGITMWHGSVRPEAPWQYVFDWYEDDGALDQHHDPVARYGSAGWPGYDRPWSGLGNTLTKNTVIAANSLRGGAISFALAGAGDNRTYNLSQVVQDNEVTGMDIAGTPIGSDKNESVDHCPNRLVAPPGRNLWEDPGLFDPRRKTCINVAARYQGQAESQWMKGGVFEGNLCENGTGRDELAEGLGMTFLVTRLNAATARVATNTSTQAVLWVEVPADAFPASQSCQGAGGFQPDPCPQSWVGYGDPSSLWTRVVVDFDHAFSRDASCDGVDYGSSTAQPRFDWVHFTLQPPGSAPAISLAKGFAPIPPREVYYNLLLDDGQPAWVTANGYQPPQSIGFNSRTGTLATVPERAGTWTLKVFNPPGGATLCVKNLRVSLRGAQQFSSH